MSICFFENFKENESPFKGLRKMRFDWAIAQKQSVHQKNKQRGTRLFKQNNLKSLVWCGGRGLEPTRGCPHRNLMVTPLWRLHLHPYTILVVLFNYINILLIMPQILRFFKKTTIILSCRESFSTKSFENFRLLALFIGNETGCFREKTQKM